MTQPMKYIAMWLGQHATQERYLFTLQDLRALCLELSETAFKALLSRTVRAGYLVRLCRNLYLYKPAMPSHGLVLFHAASLLRAHEFNYISLETVLSDAGVISQIPLQSISIMSSGCSNKVSCGSFGTIEFIHTQRKPEHLMKDLVYDTECRLWRANVSLALTDMKRTHRNLDLIDKDSAHEFI
jgi:hypothetical protein